MGQNDFQIILDNQHTITRYLQVLLSLGIIIGLVLIVHVWLNMKRNATVDQIQRWIKYEKLNPQVRQQ